VHDEAEQGPPRSSAPAPWIITFADLMVLLMCFFVLMLSFSEMDVAKFKLLAGSMQEAFGVQTDINVRDPPKGTSLEAREFSPAIPEPTVENEVRQNTVDSEKNTLDLALELRLRELEEQERAAEQQAQRLRELFSREIDEGRLVIRHDSTDVVIQILEKDSFASGRADLEPDALATLAKIGSLVNAVRGAITVSGHTDNVPIRNGTYRSNWDLSAARAASVAHQLLAAGVDPARLMVSGHADTQPRVPNDSAANRALNRRVDITFFRATHRPGGAAGPAAGAAAGAGG
jgi:chemotaxis protein MotB